MNSTGRNNSAKSIHHALSSFLGHFSADDIQLYYHIYVFPVIFGIGSFWNLLIIIYFMNIHSKNLRKMSSYHFLIVSLAVADLCTSVIVSIIFPFNHTPSWEPGIFGCILVGFSYAVCPLVSCWLLVIISFARFRSIVYPLRARINKKRYALACLSIWSIASLVNTYILMNGELSKDGGSGDLYCDSLNQDGGTVIQFSINYFLASFLPSAIMLILYHRIKKKIKTEENENSFAMTDQSRQRNRRAMRTIRGLIWLFTLTVIPVRVYDILLLAVYPNVPKSDDNLFTTIEVLRIILSPLRDFITFLNNILNIFIYAKMIPDFRRFLTTIFTFGMHGKRNIIN